MSTPTKSVVNQEDKLHKSKLQDGDGETKMVMNSGVGDEHISYPLHAIDWSMCCHLRGHVGNPLKTCIYMYLPRVVNS